MHPSTTTSAKAAEVSTPVILIVDDEPEVRSVVAEFLEDFGYCVVQAGSSAQALAWLQENPAVELLLTDVRMPDMSGIELADIATARNPRLKVILMSGYVAARQVKRRFLHKPFRMKDLQAAVRAELEVIG